jgi:single-stranded-DNA-specific exonuclease
MHGVTEDIFLDRGGHNMSGGFSVSPEKIHLLEEALQNSYEKLYAQKSDLESPNLAENFVDHLISIDDINFPLWNTVEKLAPFGIDNHKPVFLFKNVKPIEVKFFGKTKEHLELSFVKDDGRKVVAICFFANEDPRFNALSTDIPFTLVATLEKSMFRGFPELRLRIVDVLE